MRPRLIAVDDPSCSGAGKDCSPASMRPRLIAVDDRPNPNLITFRQGASMRPRLIAVDDVFGSSPETYSLLLLQ